MIRTVHVLLASLVLAAAALPAASQTGPRPPRTRIDRLDRIQDPRNGPEITDRFTRTVRLGRDGTLDVSNVAGVMVITGGGGNDVTIDAVKRTRNQNQDEGRARLNEVQIQVTEANNRVEVRTEHPRDERVTVIVDYTIGVPQGASVTARNVSGDVKVTNVRGELRVENVSGSVEVSGGRQLASVRSVSGNVTINDSEAGEFLSLRTVSGGQVLKGLRARRIDVNTVSGDVQFDNASIERADMKSVSGNIDLTGQLARNGRYEIATHSGDVRLAIADIGFEVEANTFSGDFRSDYAVTMRGGDDPGGRGPRRRPNRTVRGTYGDGSAILDLRSFSGDIAIVKR
jgi:hypothetical protein